MKRYRLCALLLCVFLVSGCDKAPIKEAPTKPDSTEAAESIASTESKTPTATASHFLIDVRSQKEWDERHLEGTTLIPHGEIAEGIKKVTDDKNAKIYLF